MNDNRQIKLLHADQSQDLVTGGQLNVFSWSPDTCRGTGITGTDGLLLFDFSDIFNHDECAPKCENGLRNNTGLHQVCTTIIDFDDLLYTIPNTDKSVKIQSGEFRNVSCSAKLSGTVEDVGIVPCGRNSTSNTGDDSEIEFFLDVMCCDPDDTTNFEQYDQAVGKIPLTWMKIGPNSDDNSRFFFVKSEMDTRGRDMSYSHTEELRYEGFNRDNNKINDIDVAS